MQSTVSWIGRIHFVLLSVVLKLWSSDKLRNVNHFSYSFLVYVYTITSVPEAIFKEFRFNDSSKRNM